MTSQHKKHNGLIFVETCTALALLSVLLTAFAITLNSYKQFNHRQLVSQRCIAACQAQIDSIAATGRPIPDDELTRLWPKLRITFELTQGQGDWAGLRLIRVTSSAKSHRKEVEVTLGRYISSTQEL